MELISFNILMQLLSDRDSFLSDIQQKKKLDIKILSLLFYSSLFFGLYGAIIGSSNGGFQILSSALKLPALYLLTLLICLPTLYFFDVIFGSKSSCGQYVALLFASMSMISVMLLGLAPVTLFFRLSMNEYEFFLLLNVTILSLTGFIGIKFFHKAMKTLIDDEQDCTKNRRKLIRSWLFLYGFVGSQLGWTLRPFFGSPGEPFALFRYMESNFYVEVLRLIGNILGMS